MASPWQSVMDIVKNGSNWFNDIMATLSALLYAFIISAVAGTIIGFFIGLSTFWSKVFNPILVALYSLPKVILYPIFLLIFGLTVDGRIAFAISFGIFPIIITCMDATRLVPNIYLKIAKCYRMSFWQKARHILIPSILPMLVVGLRMGFGLCFLGLILSEMFASYDGLGYRLIQYSHLERNSSVLGLFLIITFIATFITYFFLLWQEKNELKIGKSNSSI